MQTWQQRHAIPERWQRALQRALFAGVEAKQLAGSGEWIVSSSSRPGIAYRMDGVSCDCEAAMLGGDPVCLHRAAHWYTQGLLKPDPEPEPPAPAVASCWGCSGGDVQYFRSGNMAPCDVCGGTRAAPLVAQAAALVAATGEPLACGLCIGSGYDDETGRLCGLCRGTGIEPAGTCNRYSEPLDDDARTDDALVTLCGACIDASHLEVLAARQNAIRAALAAWLAPRARGGAGSRGLARHVRFVQGAAYQHLRPAMTAPTKVCRGNGHGCEACGGRGTVPAAPPEFGFDRPPASV
jgi:hypothetical protein